TLARPAGSHYYLVAVRHVFCPSETVDVARGVKVALEESGRCEHEGLVIVQGSFLFALLYRNPGKVLIKRPYRNEMPAAISIAIGADVIAYPEIADDVAVVAEK